MTGNLVRVRTLVSQHLAKADEEKTTDWLYACTKGDNNKVRQVRALPAGCHVFHHQSVTGVCLSPRWRDEHAQWCIAMCNSGGSRYRAGVRLGLPARLQMLRQGFNVDTCDYDGRTGLMLASAHGNLEIVHSLLAAGAEPSLKDNLGGSALMEACKGGHENLVTVLRDAGAE